MADLEINIDGTCSKCGEKGTAPNGLCLKCNAQKMAQQGIIILDIEIQQLSCQLEDDELLQAGNELSKAVKDIEAEELTQKAAKSAMKDKLDTLTDKVSKLATIVKNKAEIRPVEVKHKLDEHGMVISIRSDTGEIIETRKAKPSELQRKIDIPPTEK